jgi:hypothetical protein
MSGRYTVSAKAARTVDGIVFDSKREATRYWELRIMEKSGEIIDLELQPEYELQPAFEHNGNKERAIKYRADFRYKDRRGVEVVEDVKGHRTELYRVKRKMLLHRYNDINFQEVS